MHGAIRTSLVVAALSTVSALAGSTAIAQQMAQQPQMDMKPMAQMANELKPFTKEAYAAAMAAGKTTLVFFHAPWCPVCRAQEPKVLALLNGDFTHVVAFKVDYDTNRDLRRDMKVDKQSTLILSQGMKEVARLSYKSDDASIQEFFAHAKMMLDAGR
jgi:thiol-disulfide isomerase/thioredoxin